MTALVSEFFSTVFRPSVAALLIVGGISLLSIENTPHSLGKSDVRLAELGCNGLLSPVCNTLSVFR